MLKVLLLISIIFASTAVLSASHYKSGNIINITSYSAGMLIKLDSGAPANCLGTPNDWLLIKEENKTMISVALSMWATGKTWAIVYTDPYAGSGYCVVKQLDPTN